MKKTRLKFDHLYNESHDQWHSFTYIYNKCKSTVTTLVIWSQHVICPVGGSMRPLCCVCVIFSCLYVSLWGFWISQNKGNSRIPETLNTPLKTALHFSSVPSSPVWVSASFHAGVCVCVQVCVLKLQSFQSVKVIQTVFGHYRLYRSFLSISCFQLTSL